MSRIREYKAELDGIWQDAKTQARKDQANSLRAAGWREGIRYAYSVELPLDLIEWLNESIEQREQYMLSSIDLSHLQKKLENGYVLSKPSDIALEHAARLCGCPPYRFSISRLRQIWKKPPGVIE